MVSWLLVAVRDLAVAAGRARLIVAAGLLVVVRLDVALRLDMAARLLEAVRLLVAVARALLDGSGKGAAARLGCAVYCCRVARARRLVVATQGGRGGGGKRVTVTVEASNPGPHQRANLLSHPCPALAQCSSPLLTQYCCY